MNESNDAIIARMKEEMHEAMRANDIYNVLVNRKSSEYTDVLETIATVIASHDRKAKASGTEILYTNMLELAVREKVSRHYSSQFFTTTEVFFQEGKKIAANPSELRNRIGELTNKKETLKKFQKNLIQSIILNSTSTKIGGVCALSITQIGLVIKLNKLNENSFSCSQRDFLNLESLIDIKTLPIRLSMI